MKNKNIQILEGDVDMEEIKKQIEKLEEELKALKDKLEDTANDGWKPEYGQTYWFVDLDTMDINKSRWFNGDSDKARLRHKVIFKTEEKAEEYLEYLEEKEKHMNTFTEEEWKNNPNNKYYYYYNYKDNKIDWDWVNNLRENVAYFRKNEEVENFINKYEWQIKHELGVN